MVDRPRRYHRCRPHLLSEGIPYGGAGPLTVTVINGTATGLGAQPCDDGGSNPVWYQMVGTPTLLSLFNTQGSLPGGFPATTGGSVNGDTSQEGTYQVAVCSRQTVGFTGVALVSNDFVIGPFTVTITDTNQSAVTTTINTTTPASVPEFPLGLLWLMVLAVPAILSLRLFLKKTDPPALDSPSKKNKVHDRKSGQVQLSRPLKSRDALFGCGDRRA